MYSDTLLVEYGHTHLDSIVDEQSPPDLTTVSESLALLDSEYDIETMVLIDDTSYNGTYDTYPTEAIDAYIESLALDPDYVVFETAFRPSFDSLLALVPQVDSPFQDMAPSLFYSVSDAGLYLYWATGDEFSRIRVTDYRESRHKRGYTPAFRCAAMTLGKLGVVPSPQSVPTADAVLTFHRPEFYESPQYERAEVVRTRLNEAGVISFDTTDVDKRCMGETV